MTYSTVFKATKLSPISNTIVEELNAAVLTKTFPGKGVFEADLYTSPHGGDSLVWKGSCPPAVATYVKTVTIEL